MYAYYIYIYIICYMYFYMEYITQTWLHPNIRKSKPQQHPLESTVGRLQAEVRREMTRMLGWSKLGGCDHR